MIILSVLIPTIPEHNSKFKKLFNELHRQHEFMNTFHDSLGEIEILVDASKKFLNGGLSIGKKREALVKRATGRYSNFLDADDGIAPNYLETLVRLCKQEKDICTFRNLTKTDFYWCVVDMSLSNPINEEATPDRVVKRRPFHTCPVRTEYAKQYEFDDINYGEDAIWMDKVLTQCSTEAHTDKVIHEYLHSKKHSESDKITRHEELQSIK